MTGSDVGFGVTAGQNRQSTFHPDHSVLFVVHTIAVIIKDATVFLFFWIAKSREQDLIRVTTSSRPPVLDCLAQNKEERS
jgi:hypothetical protein